MHEPSEAFARGFADGKRDAKNAGALVMALWALESKRPGVLDATLAALREESRGELS